MKKLLTYTGFILTGITLTTIAVCTSDKGLSDVNKEAYKAFVNESNKVEELGFTNYETDDFKVRIFDGDNDYVGTSDGKWSKEKALLDVIAGTTLPVNDEYQAIVPSYEKMKGLTDIVGGIASLQNDGEEAFSNDTFTENMYTATICHEVFHSWQLTNFEDSIVNGSHSYNGDREAIILNEIDTNEELKASVCKEAELLYKAYFENDTEQKYNLIKEALKESEERNVKLSENAANTEYFVENIEGSARYIEAMAYKDLAGEEEFNDYYLGEFTYIDGSEKYYTLGFLRCLLLDQVNPGWQSEFTYDNGCTNILADVVK